MPLLQRKMCSKFESHIMEPLHNTERARNVTVCYYNMIFHVPFWRRRPSRGLNTEKNPTHHLQIQDNNLIRIQQRFGPSSGQLIINMWPWLISYKKHHKQYLERNIHSYPNWNCMWLWMWLHAFQQLKISLIYLYNYSTWIAPVHHLPLCAVQLACSLDSWCTLYSCLFDCKA